MTIGQGGTIKIIVADDHSLVRTGICNVLEGEPSFDVVGQAASGEDAVKMTRELEPDVVLMDISMPPGYGGLEATRKIKQYRPETAVIIVTVINDDLVPKKLFKAGASGYLTKGADYDELKRAVRTVVQNGKYISAEIASKLAATSVHDGDESPFTGLSQREFEIAMLMLQSLSIKKIGDQLNISPKTVHTNKTRIFKKLNIKSMIELAKLANRLGIMY